MNKSNGKHPNVPQNGEVKNHVPKDHSVNDQFGREIAETLAVVRDAFFAPALHLLFALQKHERAGVRLFATTVVADVVIHHFPALTAELLAEAAWRLKNLAEKDADSRVRCCSAEMLCAIVGAAKGQRHGDATN